MPLKARRATKPTAKILAINLPPSLHRRFLKEAQLYGKNGNGNGIRGQEKFLFSLMKKYLALSKKNRSSR